MYDGTVTANIDPAALDPLGRPVWELAGHKSDGSPIYRPADYDDCGACENDEHQECGLCACC